MTAKRFAQVSRPVDFSYPVPNIRIESRKARLLGQGHPFSPKEPIEHTSSGLDRSHVEEVELPPFNALVIPWHLQYLETTNLRIMNRRRADEQERLQLHFRLRQLMKQVAVKADWACPYAKVATSIEQQSPPQQNRDCQVSRRSCDEVPVPAENPPVRCVAEREVNRAAEVLPGI